MNVMSTVAASPLTHAPDRNGTPAWDVAYLFPMQGTWSEQDYLALPGNRLVEFSDGTVEVLPMPTDLHQAIVAFIYEALAMFVRSARLGTARFAPLAVRTVGSKCRMPDVLFLLAEHDDKRHNDLWDTADLVLEVVSGDSKDRERDFVTKRAEYARGGIPEYWIVDPETRKVTVLSLRGEQYEEHGVFSEGESATSVLLPGFSVAVTEVFAVK
jgi:Uma2 family endonuclease